MKKIPVTCPECGTKNEVEMKDNACQSMFVCSGCGKRIMAKHECCVICEYSDEQCPVSIKGTQQAQEAA